MLKYWYSNIIDFENCLYFNRVGNIFKLKEVVLVMVEGMLINEEIVYVLRRMKF